MLRRAGQQTQWFGWRRLTLGLWLAAVYLALLYVAFQWGGGSIPDNILPSAD
jgi:hypothetical protein